MFNNVLISSAVIDHDSCMEMAGAWCIEPAYAVKVYARTANGDLYRHKQLIDHTQHGHFIHHCGALRTTAEDLVHRILEQGFINTRDWVLVA